MFNKDGLINRRKINDGTSFYLSKLCQIKQTFQN